jgi:predicted Zn-dependent protease
MGHRALPNAAILPSQNVLGSKSRQKLCEGQFEWESVILEDEQINAFCLPGGKIVVFTGLLKFVRDDDELATVIAHEVAHTLAGHQNERTVRDRTDDDGLLGLPYSHDKEAEADRIGLLLMTNAGYDSHRAVEFWRRIMMARRRGIPEPELVSDHPNSAHRIVQMKSWIEADKTRKTSEESRVAKNALDGNR